MKLEISLQEQIPKQCIKCTLHMPFIKQVNTKMSWQYAHHTNHYIKIHVNQASINEGAEDNIIWDRQMKRKRDDFADNLNDRQTDRQTAWNI